MREYRVLEQSAVTGKNPEEFGEAFIPELVYDAIKRVERFSSMRVMNSFPPYEISLANSTIARPSTGCGRVPWISLRRVARGDDWCHEAI